MAAAVGEHGGTLSAGPTAGEGAPGAGARARGNPRPSGRAAGLVTPDLKRAHRVIGQLEAGICWLNTWGESPAQMPVGGYKQSGIGRENGLQTLMHYTQTKSVQVELGDFVSVFN